MRPELRSRGEPCERARDLMIEAMASDPGRPPESLSAHLEVCADCRREWLEMIGELASLRRCAVEEPLPKMSSDLLQRTLLRLDERRAYGSSDDAVFDGPLADGRTGIRPGQASVDDDGLPAWWVRLLQHAYLATLGIGLWLSLSMGQTWFLEAMRDFGFEFSWWVMLDYGLFIAWFVAGGLSAMVALPLLIQESLNHDTSSTEDPLVGPGSGSSVTRWLGKWRTGRIRCLVWVW